MRLEMETRKLEDIVDQSIIKNCGARKFSLFGLRLGIWQFCKYKFIIIFLFTF
mgnify:CR=1 FL=1